MQDRVSQPGIVTDTERSQNRTVRKVTDETLALEREPHGRIAQPGGVTRRDDCLPDVEMVPMRKRKAGDNNASRLITWPGIVGKTREFLEQG